MSGELEKRASDAEREQVVGRLRDASSEGRLTLEELADRTALAYTARSHAELAPLTDDLPAALAPSPAQAGAVDRARSSARSKRTRPLAYRATTRTS